jgi:DNA-binding XRE family transcriptional regulator
MIPPGITVFDDGTILNPRGIPLKPSPNTAGYLKVGATVDGKRATFQVHALVCEAFHGVKPFAEAQVRHRNGIKTDNRASNLTWGTAAENAADKVLHGTSSRGSSKLTERQVEEIRSRYAAGGVSQKDLAATYGVSPKTICVIVNRKQWVLREPVGAPLEVSVPDGSPPRKYVSPESCVGGTRTQRGSKLTEHQVRDIRSRYAAGGARMVDLADEYEVTKKTISVIVNRKQWTKV